MMTAEALITCVFLATTIMGVRYGILKRRKALHDFARAVREGPEPTALTLEYGDVTETETAWRINGTLGERQFVFDAVETRRDGRPRAKYTLTLGPSEGRTPDFTFGGDSLHSRSDQRALSTLFGLLWPPGNYPLPLSH